MKKMILLVTLILSLVMLSACTANDGVLRVGMDLSYPPFATVNSMNEPEGISVDIAKKFTAMQQNR